jgi:hypothetical protein
MPIKDDPRIRADWYHKPPGEADIPRWMSCGDLARLVYPDITYDHAFPHSWFERCLALGFDPRGRFVWGYHKGMLMGQPLPLTKEAARDIPAALI